MPASSKFGCAPKLFFYFFLGGEPKCHTLCGREVPAERAGPSSLLTACRLESFSYILVPSWRPQDQEKCSPSRELPASQMQNLFSSSPDTSMQTWFNSFIYVELSWVFSSAAMPCISTEQGRKECGVDFGKVAIFLWSGKAKWRWLRQCAIKAAHVCLCSEPHGCFPKH